MEGSANAPPGILEDDSIEALEAKIAEYKANLLSIREAAAALGTDDPELSKIQHDLQEVVTFFEDLLRAKKQEERDVTGDIIGLPEETASSKSAENQLTSSFSSLIGRTCMTMTNSSRSLFGEVIEIGPIDPRTTLPKSIKILWFNSQRREDVSIESLRLVNPVSPDAVQVGMEAQALYAKDGLWYPCKVDGIVSEASGNKLATYKITYKQYETSEIVAADRLAASPPSAASGGASNAVKKKVINDIVTPAGYVIPENLIARPKDSALVRAEKKKRVNALKKVQKAEKIETAARANQSSWWRHQNKSREKMALKGSVLKVKEVLSPEEQAVADSQAAKRRAIYSSENDGRE